VFIFPLSLIRNLTGFRYISLIVMGSMFYTMVVMLVQLPAYFEHNYRHGRVVWAVWDIEKILSACTVAFFAYTCQLQLLPVYCELQDRSVRRIMKVVNRAVGIQALTFFVITLAGYFATFELTAQIVLQRKALGGDFIDPFMLVAIVGTIALMLIHAPVCYFPWRLAFF